MTISEWREFLQQWADKRLATDEKFPQQVRKRRWLGSPPATEEQLLRLEKRLGFALPRSYRNFLLTTNGWSHATTCIKRILPFSKVDWLQTREPEMLDVWSPEGDEHAADEVPGEEYFSYDLRPIFHRSHLRQSLLIAEPVDGDSMIYVLNPLIVAPDGEWEAWRFANWIPGAERFPSFELLMRAEYELLSTGEQLEQFVGPYTGIYAPDQPRHVAQKIGRGRAKPKRLSIPELIAQLESPVRSKRLSAANHLLREFCPHNPADEHPELVDPLSRILKSDVETDIRSAAAAMLGSYGDANAIGPLISALEDPMLTGIALSALFYISLYMADSRIADAMVRVLETPRPLFETQHAVHILEELKDARLADIGLRLLDRAPVVLPDMKDVPDPAYAHAYHRSTVRFLGAFAFAKFATDPIEELVKRLTDAHPEIRAAAVAALREKPRPDVAQRLSPLLNDPDPAVRQQASCTLEFLKPAPAVEISPERLAEVEAQASAQFQKASRRKSRF